MTITTDNYELWFYRYCEGELDERERREVESFAAQHPALAEELSLYDPGLKLQAPPMVYADKEHLMHREQRVVPLWRWAVAACLAAAGGTSHAAPTPARAATRHSHGDHHRGG